MLRRTITVVVILLLVALGLMALRSGQTDPPDSLARAIATGVLRVGYANEAPYAYLDPQSGKVTGEAVEVIRTIAHRLGITQVEGVLMEFGALIPGLQAGRFDVIAAGMYITAPRATQVAFTDPTYLVQEGFLVPKGNPLGLHGYADIIAQPTTRLGVVAGAVQHGWARTLGVPDERIVVFPDNASAVAGMAAGRADAIGLTSLTIRDLLQRGASAQCERADPFVEPIIDGKPARGYGAFAMRKADAALTEALNRELRSFLGTPEHATLVAPFGFGPEHSTKGATVEQVLAGTMP